MDLLKLVSADVQLAAVPSGLLAHMYFNKLEPRNPIVWLLLLFGVPALFSIVLQRVNDASLANTLTLSTLVHLLVLTCSVLLYRLSPFHPLAKYPGPRLARLSTVYMTRMAVSGKRHNTIVALHRKYGTHVRIGPNAISVADVSAVKDALGGSSGMPRAAYYRFSEKSPLNLVTSASIRTLNHTAVHAERRKAWNRAFTGQSVKEFDAPIDARSASLVKRVGEQEGDVDLGKWISYFTFDFMGDMVFGGGFEMLRDGGDTQGLWNTILQSVSASNVISNFEWIGVLLPYLPMGEGVRNMLRFAEERTEMRARRGPITKDLFYFLAEDDTTNSVPLPLHELTNEMFVAIIGGADTTASVLANAFYSLLTTPGTMERLQQEVDAEFGDEEPVDASRLARMPYLNAVINEALRLYPAVPFSIGRTPDTGSGGKMVAGRFLPEGNNLYLPIFALHRDPRYFSPSPESFIPDRWLPSASKENVLNRDAFMPFGYGVDHCVGKNVAYREMRVVIARIVQQYEIRFAEEYDSKEWLETLRDDTVFVKGRMPVRLVRRR